MPVWGLGTRSGDLQPFVVLPLYLDQGIPQSVKRFGPTKEVASPSLASRSTFSFLSYRLGWTARKPVMILYCLL